MKYDIQQLASKTSSNKESPFERHVALVLQYGINKMPLFFKRAYLFPISLAGQGRCSTLQRVSMYNVRQFFFNACRNMGRAMNLQPLSVLMDRHRLGETHGPVIFKPIFLAPKRAISVDL